MADETRSLWEIYDSEIEPWRKGRTILVLIGGFFFFVQLLTFAAFTLGGNLERALIFAVNVVFFWFVFYLIWIGLHWLRWVCGGWNMIVGFCLIIWGWRDENGIDAVLGLICFSVGVCFCLSSSVYFFAKRQRENMRWKEAVLVAGCCVLVLISLGTGLVGLAFIQHQRATEASEFANEAADHIYKDRDAGWALAHVSRRSLQEDGQKRLRYYLQSIRSLGTFEQISSAHAAVRTGLRLPNRLSSDAEVISKAKTEAGWIDLHARLFDEGDGWQIDRMWWTYA